MTKFYYFALFISGIVSAQFNVSAGTQLTLLDGGLLYTSEPLTNQGQISLNAGRL